eukprot:CAMPEP_0170488058 /NCGR_PEP_ID=MMETSP0208-20121228/6686_1 /TAXON_ID=197538 /ORGANISM="Strombidium inclinatum, Strain S3" /LENGTH=86 /DNA_ID=CAMNT_0010762493 /DNA_START=4345 /DNA_END=4608 /DNA_ORIENTATION=-
MVACELSPAPSFSFDKLIPNLGFPSEVGYWLAKCFFRSFKSMLIGPDTKVAKYGWLEGIFTWKGYCRMLASDTEVFSGLPTIVSPW